MSKKKKGYWQLTEDGRGYWVEPEKTPKGISVTVKFGEINVCVTEPDYNVNTSNINSHAKLIKKLTQSAAEATISVQKSFHD